jgi:hypothetical protein
VAGRILDSLRQPFFVNERELHKTATAADQPKASND